MLKNTLGWMAACSCLRWLQPAGIDRGHGSGRTADAQADRCGVQSQRQIALPLTPDGDWRNGDDMEAWLIEAIDGATEEVLVAVQELSLPRVAQALIAAQHRGVLVQVILENNYSRPGVNNRPSH